MLVTANAAHLTVPGDPSRPLCGTIREVLHYQRTAAGFPICEDCAAHVDYFNRELADARRPR